MSVAIPVDAWVSMSIVIGGLMIMSTTRLGALLDRVSPLCGGWSLPGLDPGHLVDLNLSLWRVLYVNVNQGRVERNWRERGYTHPQLIYRIHRIVLN